MRLYFEFEEKRRQAEVTWPKNGQSIVVNIMDNELGGSMPDDLLFELKNGNKITFIAESVNDKRLTRLQETIRRRLQELAG